MTRLQSRIALFLALACALAAPCALSACGKKAAAPAENTGASQDAQPTDEESADEQTTDEQAAKADSKDDQANSKARADTDTPADTAPLPDRSEEACALLRFYPATYVRAGGADDEPVMLSADDWAQGCLPHVDPDSELGTTIASDPASIFTPLGYIEAAVVVNDTRVVTVESDAVVVEVELEGTQQDWDHTITYTSTYRVHFGSNNLATEVEYLQ